MITAERNIITRGLPKTGQSIEYQAGDDGTYQAGWWQRRLLANNRQRFLSRVFAGDVVTIDRATSLMWAADGNEAGCNNGGWITWPNALIYAEGLIFAGFNDWRLPNIKELFSIYDPSLAPSPVDPVFFPNTDYTSSYWSSTTVISNTAKAWQVITIGYVGFDSKTSTYPIRCVRGGI